MTKALHQLVGGKVLGVSALTVSKGTITEAASAGVRDLRSGAATTADTIHL